MEFQQATTKQPSVQSFSLPQFTLSVYNTENHQLVCSSFLSPSQSIQLQDSTTLKALQ